MLADRSHRKPGRRTALLFAAAIGFAIAATVAFPRYAQAQSNAPAAAPAATLSSADRAELLRQAQAAQAAVDRLDFDAMIKLLPPAAFKLYDKATFEQQGRAAMAQLKAMGFRYLKTEYGEPTTPFRAGDDIVCFVPRTSLIEIKGRTAKSKAYWIAVRPAGGGEWKFLDGAGIHAKPDLLWRMFPALPRDIRLPEWKQEVVKS
jgi:hypothetical protein